MTTQPSPDFKWARYDTTITIAKPNKDMPKKKRKKARKLWKCLKRWHARADKRVRKGLQRQLFGVKKP